MQNLFRRPSGVYVIRLAVPAQLRSSVGKRELVQSTGTRELALAKILAATQLAQWRQQFFDLGRLAIANVAMNYDSIIKISMGHPTLASPGYLNLEMAAAASGIDAAVLLGKASEGRLRLYARLSGAMGYLVSSEALRTRLDSLGEPHVDGGDELDIPPPWLMPKSAMQHTASGVFALPQDAVAGVAGALLAGDEDGAGIVAFDGGQPGMLFVPDDVVHVRRGVVEFSTVEVEALRRTMAATIHPGDLEAARSAQNARAQHTHARVGKHAEKRLSEALAAFARDALPKGIEKPAEIERVRAGIHLLIEFEGDLKLADVDDEVLRRFREDALSTFLARENHVRAKHGTTSMKESIAAVAGAGWQIMSAAERELRLRWIARMFRWLHAKKWIAENPATGYEGASVQTKAERTAEAKTKKPREPFTHEELTAIFSAPWFKSGGGELTAAGKARRDFQPFQFWLPLLGLLCSCRIGEASQLWLDDVRQTEAGTWFLDINERTNDKDLKNTQSARQVPVHPLLIDAGFAKWCRRLRTEGFQRVFPELSWNPKTQYAKEPIRAHTEFFRGLGIPRNNTKVFHSFRRCLNTSLERQGGVTEVGRKRIMGHLPGSGVNEKHYLDDRAPDEAIKFMRFVDFKLPAISLFDQDAGVKAVRDAQNRKLGQRRGKEDMGPAGTV